jgi:hypothetical protein
MKPNRLLLPFASLLIAASALAQEDDAAFLAPLEKTFETGGAGSPA